jgi:hypothetical protein
VTGRPERADWTAATSGSERLFAGFLQTLDVNAASVASYPDAFDRLRHGTLQAIVVHDVYAADAMRAVVERLDRHDPAFLRTHFPSAFHASFFGRNVNLADPGLAGYFEEAEHFNAQLAQLMPAAHALPERVGGLLAALDGGRPFVEAPGPRAGERYMFTTLRAHVEHGHIPPHFDNEVRLRPSYRHLASLVDEHIVSFVLTFGACESGGALEVFELRCEPDAARLLSDDGVTVKPDTAVLRSVRFRVPPGSLIVLDSGRYLHAVTPVGGACTRWTACSFIARSRRQDAMYCWG